MKRGVTPKKGIPSSVVVTIALGVFIGIALVLRICLPHSDIFVGDWVKFSGSDSYYYMRLVDNISNNFPHLMAFDQYLAYPDGESVGSFYLFARFMAGISWMVGLGSPSQHAIDLVGVYTPAVLGALVVLPVYFIGKQLAGRWTGLVASALIAILPGEFLGRSIIGFSDHHIVEVLLSAITIMLLIMALKSVQKTRRIVCSLLGGFFLGLYLLTWIGGLLLVFIISLYFVVQFVSDHLRHRPTKPLCAIGAILFAVASAMFLPTVRHSFYFVSMLGILLLPLVLASVSAVMARRGMRVVYYPLAIAMLGGVILLAFYFVNPSMFKAMMGMFSIFVPQGTELTTIEMQPILFPGGNFTLSVLWGNFGLAFYAMLVSLAMLFILAAKRGSAGVSLIVVWTVVILAMALGQRRFAYYLSVNVALLTGYFLWIVLKWAGLKQWEGNRLATAENAKKSKKRRQKAFVEGFNVGLTAVIIALAIVGTNMPSTIATASHALYAPSDAWCESLDWLRENSPDPFMSAVEDDIAKVLNNPEGGKIALPKGEYVLRGDRYYQLNISEKAEYGVLSWWDYGYWITRMAHRIPNANPSQNPTRQTKVAQFLVSQDEQSASVIAQELGSEYVIIDYDTATRKFWAVAEYGGKGQSAYFGVYYVPNEQQLVAVQLFYPEYYRSLAVRLYNFDGEAVREQNVIAISYEQREDAEGNPYNLVVDARQFIAYVEAQAFMGSQESGNWRIVGNNPFVSPVPLEALGNYELAYASTSQKSIGDGRETSEVKIFQHTD